MKEETKNPQNNLAETPAEERGDLHQKKEQEEAPSPKKKPSHFNLHKMTLMAILLALAVALGLVESFLPSLGPIPGVRLGFANIVIFLALCELGFWEAAVLDLGKVFLVNLLRGTMFQMGFWMSFAGSMASLLMMAFLFYVCKFLTEVGVSAVSGMVHSLAQVGVAALILSTPTIFYYYCFLMPFSLLSGVLVGMLVRRIRATHVIENQKRMHGYD